MTDRVVGRFIRLISTENFETSLSILGGHKMSNGLYHLLIENTEEYSMVFVNEQSAR